MDSITRTPQFRAMAAAPAAQPQAAESDRADIKGSACPNLSSCQQLRGGAPTDPISVSVVMKPTRGTAAYDDLAKFAKANGLTVTTSDPQMRIVKLEGSAQAYQKAFGVELNQYKDAKGNTFRGYEGNLSMPKNLAGQVDGVLGLYNRQIAQPHTTAFKPKDMGPNGFTPTQVAAAYNFPKNLDGTGQTISIIELGGGVGESDLQPYFQKLGIKEPTITPIGVDGATNQPGQDPQGADGEVLLDCEVAGAVAPGAKINVYFAPNSEQGFVDAVAQAAKDNPKNNTISISWGSAEDNTGLWSDQALQAFNGVLQGVAQQGINTYVASGDNGSDDGVGDNAQHTDFPSSSPWTIGTGGTKMTTDANGARATEVAWGELDQQMGAAGGGVSNKFPLPDFQKGAGVPAPTNPAGGRGVPDVSGNAAPDSGYDVLVDGTEGQIGGTSAVAPLYAGLTALLGQGAGGDIGYLNPFFYKNPGVFNDITSGTNGAFSAGPGWDAITGLGSPDGTKLLAALQAAKNPPPSGS